MALSGLASTLGGTVGQVFLYNVASTVLGGLLAPEAQALSNVVFAANPTVPLSPADAASAVIRGLLDRDAAAAEAVQSGTSGARFDTLVGLTGQPPAPDELAVALRRKLISEADYERGVKQGNLRDEWINLPRALAVQQPSPTAMLEAELEGQLDHAEALARYVALGGDPDYYTILFDTQGQAPSPGEALTLANRGIIPWDGQGPAATSFEQAFLEGPWRNKWEPVFRALGEYLPPPRTVTAMFKEGSLTHDRAAELLRKQGLAADLAEAYLLSGSSQKTAKTKDLAESTIVTLYRDRLIDAGQAGSMLGSLGYDGAEAAFLLAIADLELAQRFLNAAVSRIHTLYVGHRIDRGTAGGVLAQLNVPASGIDDLLGIWDYERAANVKTLTPAEYASAMHAGIIDQATAQADLEALGYLPHDAWLYLSIHEKAPLPGEPPAISTAAQVAG